MGTIYALVAAGFLALGCYALWERGNVAKADANSAKHLVNQYRSDLAESEADKEDLKARNKKADATIKARDVRLGVLENEKRAIRGELDGLKQSAAKEDQDCLNRSLPDAFAKRLLDAGVDHSEKDGAGAGPGGANVTVLEVISPR